MTNYLLFHPPVIASPSADGRGNLIRRQAEKRSGIWYNEAVSKQYYVYIVTNMGNTVLYTGITNDLKRRVYEHKEKLVEGFTKKYDITKLVYYEVFEDIENAILREKQLKAGSRRKKVELINSMNGEWHDLYVEL